MKTDQLSIHGWLLEHNIKNELGMPISFDNHRFLWDIYADTADDLVVIKGAQIGMSTCEILRMLYTVKSEGIDIIYTLPTDTDVNDFVGGKVNRIIQNNPVLQEYVSDKDSVFQKQVGKSMVYFRSTWTKRRATMVTAQQLIHDEIDASKADVVEQYQSRLQAQKRKRRHVFSHPSVPSYGVDIFWEQSDQKHWFIMCWHCEKEQYLDWPENVDMKNKWYVCKFCGGRLSDSMRRVGRWVPRYRNRAFSGYWVNLMMCPWVPASDLVTKWNDINTTKEYFFNMILGKPYESKEGSITRSDILRNISEDMIDRNRIVIGSDSGIIKHYVVGTANGIFHYGKTENWNDITAILRMYSQSILVVDALPDITGPRQMIEEFPGRVFLSYYMEDRKTKELVRWGENENDGVVYIDRNRMIQHVVEEYKNMTIPLEGKRGDWEDYIKHWMNIYRISNVNKQGQTIFRWEKKTTEDHWVHATSYWRAGVSRFGEQAKIVNPDVAIIENSFELNPVTNKVAMDPRDLLKGGDPI